MLLIKHSYEALTLTFSRMLENLITGSLREINLSEFFFNSIPKVSLQRANF